MGSVHLGTSGWDYPEWVGPVYPRGGEVDKLRFYSRLFPVVEVNVTFYRLPAPGVVGSWVRRTPKRFRFTAKFPQRITHQDRLGGSAEELARFLEVIAPLRAEGRFAAALLQLPPSLPFDPVTVRAFYESLPEELPVAVEFRERSWLTDESFDLLREFRYAHVIVDEPLLPVRLEVTAPFSYLRFHGHGTPVWYDYRYSETELAAWAPKVRALAERSELYAFFNNHFRGDAVANARSLGERLGLPPPPGANRLDGD